MAGISGSAFDAGLFRRTFSFASPYKRTVIITAVLIVALAFLAPVRPLLIQDAIDRYVISGDAGGLTRMTILLIALLFLEALLQYYQIYLASWLGQTVIRDLRMKTYSKIISFRTQFFDKNPIGRLVTRVVSDIETIAEVFSEGLLIIFGDILKLIVVLIFMFATDWRLSLYSLIPIPFLVYATVVFKNSIKSAFQEVRTQVANLNTFVQEHVTGMSIVQLFGREEIEMEKFRDLNKAHRTAHIRTVWAYSVFFPVVELLSALSLAALVWWGAEGVISGYVTQGNLVAFILYIYMLFRPIRELADRFNTLQLGMVSSERVFRILDTEEYVRDGGKIIPGKLHGAITFEKVWFAYNDENWVLKDINLKIEARETIALVGSTGSGKSSIVNILGRYYDFQKGRILVDGLDSSAYDLASFRRKIALVQQDVMLFSDSILNNITLNDEGISFDSVVAAAKEVGLHDFIMSLPGNYNYKVGERGVMLSVGQRQLISFVRAYVTAPDILILDEATSSIDSLTEELIKASTRILTKNRTSIIVAHRLSTIQNADKIIVLHHGEIVESGRHGELLARGGYYKKYYEIQFSRESVS